MKERPMLFNGEMVRAILEGRKTQTRRIITPSLKWADEVHLEEGRDGSWIPYNGADDSILSPDSIEEPIPCPYGILGDRLWVKETFCWSGYAYNHDEVIWRASENLGIDERGGNPWKPSIHMPRWASRILLEVVSVRVERVHDITDEDCQMEGIDVDHSDYTPDPNNESVRNESVYHWEFSKLWNSINEAKGFGWDKNPWVWVVEFKVLTS